MLKFAIRQEGPVAIRYPRGEAYDGLEDHRAAIEMGKGEVLYQGEEIALLAIGNMVKTAKQVYDALSDEGYRPTLVNMRFVKPLDTRLLDELGQNHRLIVTLEENVKNGGFGEKVLDYYSVKRTDAAVRIVAIEDKFIPHGSVGDLMRQQRMDAESVLDRIHEWKNELKSESDADRRQA